MLGLYIHIPFCVQKCKYCDFNSYKIEKDKKEKFLNDLKFKTAKNKNIEIINAGTDLKSNKHCANSLCVIFKIL